MPFNHVVVWIDHSKAHVLHFNPTVVEAEMLKAHHTRHHLSTGEHLDVETRHYFDDIAAALKDVPEILVVGPGQEKLLFTKYLKQHHPLVSQNILGIETVDHPTDGQLLAYARKFFRKADLMH
ncbi:translational machinery protein [Oxalobacteraceae bacterium R-40]|uniref:Translational machinery protein n=1 Tax=Keguizhuia sedimenti TaxID=3064264 RepID=A0ABU1BPG9_9BURK|nr:translational machinery protein [Oxalobacteraceae bacterium R-40]